MADWALANVEFAGKKSRRRHIHMMPIRYNREFHLRNGKIYAGVGSFIRTPGAVKSQFIPTGRLIREEPTKS